MPTLSRTTRELLEIIKDEGFTITETRHGGKHVRVDTLLYGLPYTFTLVSTNTNAHRLPLNFRAQARRIRKSLKEKSSCLST